MCEYRNCAAVLDRAPTRSQGISSQRSRGAFMCRREPALAAGAIGAPHRRTNPKLGSAEPLVHLRTTSPVSAGWLADRRACIHAGLDGAFLIMVRSMTTSFCALIPCSRFGRM